VLSGWVVGVRVGGETVYLLDEPEAALSVTGALALLAVIVRAARAGAQSAIGARRDQPRTSPGRRAPRPVSFDLV